MASKDLGKTGHREDRTLSDVAEVKNFDWGSKGRVTSQKCKSTQKFNSRKSSKDNDKEICGSSFFFKSLNGDMS